MSNVWFTSDTHLNHGNITGPKVSKWSSGYRDFDSTWDMNEHLIKQINRYVQWDDILYHTGDFCFGGHHLTPNWRNRINCQNIHLCRGNHDNHIDLYEDSFTSVQDTLTIKHGKYTFFMSHYKHAIWMGSHKGFIHLYGHSHSNAEDWMIGKSMDVGIDNAKKLLGEYRPFKMEEVIELMNKRSVDFKDHHNSKTDV
jgi:calcineurin-like phosphoesterase family protein